MNKSNLLNNWKFLVFLCLTLGLAPWFRMEEPHIWGKINWIAGGAVGMKGLDWFDFFMHSTPFVLLIIWGVRKVRGKV